MSIISFDGAALRAAIEKWDGKIGHINISGQTDELAGMRESLDAIRGDINVIRRETAQAIIDQTAAITSIFRTLHGTYAGGLHEQVAGLRNDLVSAIGGIQLRPALEMSTPVIMPLSIWNHERGPVVRHSSSYPPYYTLSPNGVIAAIIPSPIRVRYVNVTFLYKLAKGPPTPGQGGPRHIEAEFQFGPSNGNIMSVGSHGKFRLPSSVLEVFTKGYAVDIPQGFMQVGLFVISGSHFYLQFYGAYVHLLEEAPPADE